MHGQGSLLNDRKKEVKFLFDATLKKEIWIYCRPNLLKYLEMIFEYIHSVNCDRDNHDLSSWTQGRRKVWKSGGERASSTVVGIICPPGWGRVNYWAQNCEG